MFFLNASSNFENEIYDCFLLLKIEELKKLFQK